MTLNLLFLFNVRATWILLVLWHCCRRKRRPLVIGSLAVVIMHTLDWLYFNKVSLLGGENSWTVPNQSLGIEVALTVPGTLSDWLLERSMMQHLVHQHLVRAQNYMQRQADKSRSERSFAVGDWVYMKLQPYVQSSVLPRAHCWGEGKDATLR
jgi:hypothetical protein